MWLWQGQDNGVYMLQKFFMVALVACASAACAQTDHGQQPPDYNYFITLVADKYA